MPRHAIVALLEPHDDAFVRWLWRRLADEFGLHGVAACPHPHLSYLGSAHANAEALAAIDVALADVAHREPPLTTRVRGLRTFPGDRPVVFLDVENTDALREQHVRVWSALESAGVLSDPSPLYRPRTWVPHLTLAVSDVHAADLESICRALREETLERPLTLRTVALLHQDGPTYRVLRPHLLGGRPD